MKSAEEVFFRDEGITVTSSALTVRSTIIPLGTIASVRTRRLRGWWSWIQSPFKRFRLSVETASGGEVEVLQHRSSFLVYQVAKAIERALRQSRTKAEPSPTYSLGQPV